MNTQKLTFVLFCFFLGSHIPAHAQFEWLNPLPAGHLVVDIHIENDSLAFFIYGSGLYRTDDGGNSWIEIRSMPYPDFNLDMAFHENLGVVVGRNGKAHLSVDGGDSWANVSFPTTEDIHSIQIIGQDSLVAGSSKAIYLSSDRGATWISRNIPIAKTVKTFFTSYLTAHAAGHSGYILKTTDGGISWDTTRTNAQRSSTYNDLYFVNENKGFASQGSSGDVYRTIDGGASWTEINRSFLKINAIKFGDEDTGYMCGEYGAMYKTIDGGNTWNTIPTNPTLVVEGDDLYALDFLDSSKGFVGGLKGRITQTIDGGMSWNDYSPYYYPFRNIYFPTADTGIALAYTSMFITKDGGDSWELLTDQYGAKHARIFHPDSILIAGGKNTYRTDDGGATWTQYSTPEIVSGVESMHFIDRDTGFVSGDRFGLSQFFAVTYDGGITWTNPVPFPRLSFDHLYFINSKIGFGISVGRLFKTTDGGFNWTQDSILTDDEYNGINFPSDSVGYVIEDYGHVFKTMDQGASWDTLEVHDDPLYSLHFIDENNGYVCPRISEYFVTHDGGNTWESRRMPGQVNATNVSPNGHIFFVGQKGMIARDAVLWQATSIYVDGNFSDKLKLYPNPSRGKIYLETTSNKALNIKVMDLQGKIVFYHPHFEQTFLELDPGLRGMFVIVVNDGETQYSGKILIQP